MKKILKLVDFEIGKTYRFKNSLGETIEGQLIWVFSYGVLEFEFKIKDEIFYRCTQDEFIKVPHSRLSLYEVETIC